MEQYEALSVLEGLQSDHHVWIDFKKEYYIGGKAEKKAEFIRDISSLASTITGKQRHYIAIGVADDGEIVGTSADSTTYSGSGARHICSYDEHEIQALVDTHIEPAPQIAWNTYELDGATCGLLAVTPLSDPPAVTKQDLADDSGNTVLRKGLVFVRNDSGRRLLMAFFV